MTLFDSHGEAPHPLQQQLIFDTSQARQEVKDFADATVKSLREAEAEARKLGAELESLVKARLKFNEDKNRQRVQVVDPAGDVRLFTRVKLENQIKNLDTQYKKVLKTAQDMAREEAEIARTIEAARKANHLFSQDLEKNPQNIAKVKNAYADLERQIDRISKLQARSPAQTKYLDDLKNSYKLNSDQIEHLIDLEHRHARDIQNSIDLERKRTAEARNAYEAEKKAAEVAERNAQALRAIQANPTIRPDKAFNSDPERALRESALRAAFNSKEFQQQQVRLNIQDSIAASQKARASSGFNVNDLEKQVEKNVRLREKEAAATEALAKKQADAASKAADRVAKATIKAANDASKVEQKAATETAKAVEKARKQEEKAAIAAAKASEKAANEAAALSRKLADKASTDAQRTAKATEKSFLDVQKAKEKAARDAAKVEEALEKQRYDQAVKDRIALEAADAASRKRQLAQLKSDIQARSRAEQDAAKTQSKAQQTVQNRPAVLDKEIGSLTVQYLRAQKAAEALSKANKGIGSKEIKDAKAAVEGYRQKLEAALNEAKALGSQTGNMARAQAALRGAFEKTKGPISGLLNLTSKLGFACFGLQTAIYAITAPINVLNEAFVQTNKRLEQAQLALASTFNNNYVETFSQSMRRAEGFVKDLRAEAVKTNLTFEDLQQIASQNLPTLLSRGASSSQALRVISLLGQQAKIQLGDRFEPSRLTDEIRNLLNKNIVGRTNEVLTSLGITKESLKDVHTMADLIQLLESRTKGLDEANKVFIHTFSGALDNLKDKLVALGEELGKPLFDAVTESLNHFNDALDTNKYNTVIEGTRRIVQVLTDLVKSLGLILGKLGENVPGLPISLGEYLLRLGGAAAGGAAGGFLGGALGSVIPGAGTVAGASVGTIVGGVSGFFTPELLKAGSVSADQRKLREARANLPKFLEQTTSLSDLISLRNDLALRSQAEDAVFPLYGQSLKNSKITGLFREPRPATQSTPAHTHKGVDIAAKPNTTVLTTESGEVVYAKNLKNAGLSVGIQSLGPNGEKVLTEFFELANVLVKQGDIVKKGEAIALSGGVAGTANAGNSTGPHLHIQKRVNGQFVNPLTGTSREDLIDKKLAQAQIAQVQKRILELSNQSNLPDPKNRNKITGLGTTASKQPAEKLEPESLRADLPQIKDAKKISQEYEAEINKIEDANSKLQASLNNLNPGGLETIRAEINKLEQEQQKTIEAQSRINQVVADRQKERNTLEAQYNAANTRADEARARFNANRTDSSLRDRSNELDRAAEDLKRKFTTAQSNYQEAVDLQNSLQRKQIEYGVKLIEQQGQEAETTRNLAVANAERAASFREFKASVEQNSIGQAFVKMGNDAAIADAKIKALEDRIKQLQTQFGNSPIQFDDNGNPIAPAGRLNESQKAAFAKLQQAGPELFSERLSKKATLTDDSLAIFQKQIDQLDREARYRSHDRGTTQVQKDVETLQAYLEKIKEIDNALQTGLLNGEEVTPDVRLQLQDFRDQFVQTTREIQQAYTVNVVDAGKQAFDSFFDSILNGTANFTQAFLGFFKDIATQMERILSSNVADKLNQILFKGKNGFPFLVPQSAPVPALASAATTPGSILNSTGSLLPALPGPFGSGLNGGPASVRQNIQQGVVGAYDEMLKPGGLLGQTASAVPATPLVSAGAGSTFASKALGILVPIGGAIGSFQAGRSAGQQYGKGTGALAGLGAGALIGGLAGSILGPVGTILGASVGGTLGGIGGLFGGSGSSARQAQRAEYQNNVLSPYLNKLVNGADPNDLSDLQKRVVQASRGMKANGSAGQALKRDAMDKLKDMIKDLQKRVSEALDALNEQIEEFARPLTQRGIVPEITKTLADLKEQLKMGVNPDKIFEAFNLTIRDQLTTMQQQLDDTVKQINQGAEDDQGNLISLAKGLSNQIEKIQKDAQDDLENIRESFASQASAIIGEGRASAITPSAESRQQRLAILGQQDRKQETDLQTNTTNSILRATNETNREIADLQKSANTTLDQIALLLSSAINLAPGSLGSGFNTGFLQDLQKFVSTFNPFQALSLVPALDGGIGINIDKLVLPEGMDATSVGQMILDAIAQAEQNRQYSRTAQQA